MQQHNQLTDLEYATHLVDVVAGSRLAEWAGASEVRVNTLHHQAIKDIKAPLVVTATAKDGVIEAFESDEHSFFVGVQWHPEALVKRDDPTSLRLFEGFVEACKVKVL